MNAFEQSLSNMTQRLQQLTITSQQKVPTITINSQSSSVSVPVSPFLYAYVAECVFLYTVGSTLAFLSLFCSHAFLSLCVQWLSSAGTGRNAVSASLVGVPPSLVDVPGRNIDQRLWTGGTPSRDAETAFRPVLAELNHWDKLNINTGV